MPAALRPRSFGLNRIPDNLLREPLEYLKADHVRQRRICDGLEELLLGAMQDSPADVIEVMIAYLSGDFLLHIKDEEIDLFPHLRAACRPEDEIDDLLDGLRRDHAADESLANGIVQDLHRILDVARQADTPNFSQLAGSFSMTERRHLKLEDDVILPLAQRRLSPDELERIGRSMAARRNIAYPA